SYACRGPFRSDSECDVEGVPHAREEEKRQAETDQADPSTGAAPDGGARERGEAEADDADQVEDRDLFGAGFERGKQHSVPPCPDSPLRLSSTRRYPSVRGGKLEDARLLRRQLAVDDAPGDVMHFDPVVHGLLLEEPPGLLLTFAVLVHEDALGRVVRLAGRQPSR